LKGKKGKSRKTAGLIISGVGAALYLGYGLILLIVGFTYYSAYTIALLIAGGISTTGVIVAINKVKIGGIIILISIPIAFVIGIVLSTIGTPYYYYYQWIYVMQYVLFPFPIPHSAHIIAGGIICLTAADREF